MGVAGGRGKVDASAVDPNLVAWRPYTGIYYRNSKTTKAGITDGTSQTLAFGEAGWAHRNGMGEYEISWLGSGSMMTKNGLSPIFGPNGDDYIAWQFRSMHPGIVNFAFADGSVHAISQASDFNTYIYLSGMADRRVIGSAGFE